MFDFDVVTGPTHGKPQPQPEPAAAVAANPAPKPRPPEQGERDARRAA
ncbi:MAG: hypothetical protein AB7P02_24190 [Alphaproteobacteria bacterium]